MNNYDPIKFTQRLVFGKDTDSYINPLSTDNDYNDHIRPEGSIPPGFEFDMLDYLTNGAGRYATPAVFPLVDKFFAPSTDLQNGITYFGTAAIRKALGFDATGDEEVFKEATEVAIWQYGTDTLSLDFAERAYLFGTTGFTLDLTNAKFIVGYNDERSITGLRVKADKDNFDFVGGAGIINKLAKLILEPAYDPYGLTRKEVPIEFTTSIDGREYGTSATPYGFDKYGADEIYETTNTSVVGTVSGVAKLATGMNNFFIPGGGINPSVLAAGSYLSNINSDPFLRYRRGDFKVIYGTPGNDDIDKKDQEYDISDISPIPSKFLMVGGTGNDSITGNFDSDELLGGDGNDVLKGDRGNDTLNGSKGNESLDGGGGHDKAIFTDEFKNYDIATTGTTIKTTTITHKDNGIDGVDTLKNVEFGIFQGELIPLENARLATEPAPRIIPLPLEDGVIETETKQATDTTASPNPNDPLTPPYVSLTMPVEMLDGNVDYTLNISPYKPDTQYNIIYIIDTPLSMSVVELQAAKDAYVDLTNYFIDNGLAEDINFGVVSFGSSAVIQKDSTGSQNLTANEAISAIRGLTTDNFIGTDYSEAFYQGVNFLTGSPLGTSSPLNPGGTTSISYFFSDQRSYLNSYNRQDESKRLRRYSNVQAFGWDENLNNPSLADLVMKSEIDFADSNDGVMMSSIADLSTELQKSGLAGKVDHLTSSPA
ncbi:MAG: hypothetical protein ACRC2S_15720 [Waterburya sp.]